MKAEDRWERFGDRWGVRIEKGMRLKDLPADMRMTATPHEGALHPFTFKSGQFVALTWNQETPLDWPVPSETPLEPGDVLIETSNLGVSFIRKDDLP